MAYIVIDKLNQITAASRTHHCGNSEIEVNIPEEIWENGIHNYKYENGNFTYFKPQEEESYLIVPTTEERIGALEAAVAMLCLADVEV